MPVKSNLHDKLDRQLIENIQEDEGSVGAGGIAGEIAFRYKDPMSGPVRDDFLPPQEIQRLLIIHKDTHKDRVDKQKIKRQEREAQKAGKYVSSLEKTYTQGGGSGPSSSYKSHPISQKVQFSGMRDSEVVGIANLNDAETNAELKDKLENRFENKYRNTPKLRYPGG